VSISRARRRSSDTSTQFVAGRTKARPESRMYSSISRVGAHTDLVSGVRMLHCRRAFARNACADAIGKTSDVSKTYESQGWKVISEPTGFLQLIGATGATAPTASGNPNNSVERTPSSPANPVRFPQKPETDGVEARQAHRNDLWPIAITHWTENFLCAIVGMSIVEM
jgi:hypothetical protein